MPKNLILFILSIFVLSSCVIQKKYDELLAEKVKLESQLNDCSDSLSISNLAVDSLSSATVQLASDTTKLGESIRKTKSELATLKTDHKQLDTHYNNLLNNSGKLSRDLAEQQQSLIALKDNLERTRQLNEQLNADLEIREKKVKDLENVIKKEVDAANQLKKRISDALLNFKASDLTVQAKNGKIYVSMTEKLLFQSGSITVDSKGVSALKQLAQAIKNQQDIQIMVEGHTDNVPISKTGKYFQDNWDLSVLRATSITRILIINGVKPNQVLPAGKGEYSPLTANTTKEDKQKNRRTDIIITPNLDELYTILNSN